MADTTEKGLKNITAELVEVNKKLQVMAGGLSPAEEKQDKEDEQSSANKSNSLLKKIGSGIGNLWDSQKKAAKAALKGAGAAVLAIAMGAALYGIGEFLQSETFQKMLKYIKTEIMPGIEKFYNFLVDNWEEIAVLIAGIIVVGAITKFITIATNIKNAFLAVKTFMLVTMLPAVQGMIGNAMSAGKASFAAVAGFIKNAFLAVKTFMLVTMLENVKGMIGNAMSAGKASFAAVAGFIKNAFIAVKTFMLGTMLPAVQGMIGSAMTAGKASFAAIAGKITLAFIAVKTFMVVTMLPMLAAWAIPIAIIVGIAAAVGIALYALWNAFEDFCETLNKTGSIGEALKVGAAKFMGTILGFIPWLILELVGWVAGLFGFKKFKEKVKAIDPIQYISDTIKVMFDCIFDWFGLLFADPVAALKNLWTAALGGFKSLTDILFWPVNKAIAWVQKLFGWGDPAEPFTVQGFIAEVWAKVKTWFTGLFKWAAKEDAGDSWLVTTIKCVIIGVKKWFGKMFDFGTLKSSLASIINIVLWLPNLVKDAVASVGAWLLCLFGFDAAAEKVANAKNWTIGGLIMGVVDDVVLWLKGLFKWGKKAGTTKDGEFSLWKLVCTAIQKVWDWFKGLLDIDVMAIARQIPGAETLIGWMTTTKEEAAAAAAEKIAEEKKRREIIIQRRKEAALARQEYMDEVKERIAQQQLWLDTKGKQGKEFQMSMLGFSTKYGSAKDREDQRELIAEDKERLSRMESSARAKIARDAQLDFSQARMTQYTDASTTSSVTTTGSSNVYGLQNNKFFRINTAAYSVGAI